MKDIVYLYVMSLHFFLGSNPSNSAKAGIWANGKADQLEID
jgi:hypothetical protein